MDENGAILSFPHFALGSRNLIRRWFRVVLLLFVLVVPEVVRGQTPPQPVLPLSPATIAMSVPAESVEDRLRRMEEMNEKLLKQLTTLSHQYEALSKRVGDPNVQRAEVQTPGGRAEDEKASGPEGTIGRGTDDADSSKLAGGSETSVPAEDGKNVTNNRARGAQGTIGRGTDDEKPRPIKTTVSDGLKWRSDDDEFELVFHDLTQVEYRSFPGLGGHSVLKDSFFIPRQRFYFTGRVTKNVEFYTVLNRGYGAIDLLDAFITLN